jgi:hypothetical protein
VGRLKANKLRRDRQRRFHIDDRAVSQAEIVAAGTQLSENVDAHGRLLYMASLALGLGQVATSFDPATGPMETTHGEDPMPVALFEPERAMMSRLPGGEPKEIQVEDAIAVGLRRFPRAIADLRTSSGWALHRLLDERLELRSPDGGVYSRITVPASPDWYSAALHHGYVVCFYGSQLGGTCPAGKLPGAVHRRQAPGGVPRRPGPWSGHRRHRRLPQQPLTVAVLGAIRRGGWPRGGAELGPTR